jgi:hypothetical protein
MELGDLGFIDAFFAPANPGLQDTLTWASKYQGMTCTGAMTGGRIRVRPTYEGDPSGPWITREIASPARRDSFFCTPRPDIYRNASLDAVSNMADYFGIDMAKPWRSVRPILLNIENLLHLTGDPMRPDRPSYPWPGPMRITPYWWELARGGLRDLVRQPGILTEDAARLWVTLSVLMEYNKVAAYARDQMEKSAKSERFNLTVLTVALAAFGLVLGIAIGPLIAGGFKVASGVLTDVEKRDAAKDLNSAAKELQTTDPAFAGQVQWSAQYIQRMLTEASRPAGTPPPGQGGGALEAVVGIGVPTLLSIGLSLLGRR